MVTVVGIGADGWAGLAEPARAALRAAGVVLGGPRQLGLVEGCPEVTARVVPLPVPLLDGLPAVLAEHAGAGLVVLASGDPMWFGIGSTLVRLLGADAVRVLPAPSSISLACARLGWPVQDVEVVSAVGRPLSLLHPAVQPGRRLLVLSADAGTPARVAALLRERGFDDSPLVVLERLGGPAERATAGTARAWAHPPGDALNVVAVECRAGRDAPVLPRVPGLPDDAYEHDGQLTKQEVRAVTLARLAPLPGRLLWDVGAGAGSVGIEWMRSHPSCRAVAVEARADRAARIGRNADRLGVPGLRVVTGRAPAALAGLPTPDAVFVGGGASEPGVLDACWQALPAGGRLVATGVTLETEAALIDRYRRHGGELTRLAVERAGPVGSLRAWSPARPVVQWAVTREEDA